MIQISKCCDSQAVGELGEVEDATFGKCSDCGDYTFFDTVDEAHAELLEESNRTPHTFIEHEASRDRLKIIGPKCGFPEDVITTFNPAIISWIAERLGITAEDGVDQALADGHFVINTASEIDNDAQIKMAVEPGSGTVLHTLNAISEVVNNVLATTNQKVVFHCAMGMERSVLACIWFMASRWRMPIGKSYRQIKENRPIALDRSNWIIL
jgi:hypothetical protein